MRKVPIEINLRPQSMAAIASIFTKKNYKFSIKLYGEIQYPISTKSDEEYTERGQNFIYVSVQSSGGGAFTAQTFKENLLNSTALSWHRLYRISSESVEKCENYEPKIKFAPLSKLLCLSWFSFNSLLLGKFL